MKNIQEQINSHPITAYGVDGCHKGWFFIALKPDGEIDWGLVSTVRELVTKSDDSDRIFIDIPIGLSDSPDERLCDKEARKQLGQPRGSSVFRAPARYALSAETYVEACKKNQEKTGKRLSQQTFGIMPKIREIDDLMRSYKKARHLIREIHPEICFWALNERNAMKFKKSKQAGIEERLAVVERIRPSARQEFNKILKCFRRKDVGRDDILDAMVASVTASADASALCNLPAQLMRDEYGLPMEMVYVSASETVGKIYDTTQWNFVSNP